MNDTPVSKSSLDEPVQASMPRQARVLTSGFHFVEAPRWRNERLYFSDFFGPSVYALDSEGKVHTVCSIPGQPSGLGFDLEGRLLVVSMLDRKLMRLQGSQLVEVADLTDLSPAPLNDMVVDASGRAYIGNFGSDFASEGVRPTRVIRVDPDGTLHVAAENLVTPNGSVITPDGRTMLIAESFAFRISAFRIADDGSLHDRREWARFGDEPAGDFESVLATKASIPDGICLDAEGAVWVGDAKRPGVARIEEGGRVLETVTTGDLAVFAAALGGIDRRTLYMCAGPPLGANDPASRRLGVILDCDVDVPGAGLP
jgi:sugar lactone lactonase YvrE